MAKKDEKDDDAPYMSDPEPPRKRMMGDHGAADTPTLTPKPTPYEPTPAQTAVVLTDRLRGVLRRVDVPTPLPFYLAHDGAMYAHVGDDADGRWIYAVI